MLFKSEPGYALEVANIETSTETRVYTDLIHKIEKGRFYKAGYVAKNEKEYGIRRRKSNVVYAGGDLELCEVHFLFQWSSDKSCEEYST